MYFRNWGCNIERGLLLSLFLKKLTSGYWNRVLIVHVHWCDLRCSSKATHFSYPRVKRSKPLCTSCAIWCSWQSRKCLEFVQQTRWASCVVFGRLDGLLLRRFLLCWFTLAYTRQKSELQDEVYRKELTANSWKCVYGYGYGLARIEPHTLAVTLRVEAMWSNRWLCMRVSQSWSVRVQVLRFPNIFVSSVLFVNVGLFALVYVVLSCSVHAFGVYFFRKALTSLT